MKALLPIGRTSLAIVAGYLGLFARVIFPAPLALGFSEAEGINIKKNPHKHGMGRAIFGTVTGSLFTIPLFLVVVATFFAR